MSVPFRSIPLGQSPFSSGIVHLSDIAIGIGQNCRTAMKYLDVMPAVREDLESNWPLCKKSWHLSTQDEVWNGFVCLIYILLSSSL